MIEIIDNGKIEKAMSNNHRQYLVGDLKLPQELEFIRDKDVEMGMTNYSEYALEKPHYHTEVTEYQIILNGSAKYIDLDLNKEITVTKGDVFVIRPNTRYIQKSPKGTVILFFKYPGINDKMLIDCTDKMLDWGQCWEKEW